MPIAILAQPYIPAKTPNGNNLALFDGFVSKFPERDNYDTGF